MVSTASCRLIRRSSVLLARWRDSTGVAYLLFTALADVFFTVLRSLAGNSFVPHHSFSTMEVTMKLAAKAVTAGLIRLVCLYPMSAHAAGAALGLMVIKPHLAVAIAALHPET